MSVPSDSDAVVRTERLTKYYGPQRGIEDLDMEVRRGEVFGFLGPNGAGKTTTIRLLLGLLRPTRGGATILGRDFRAAGAEVRHQVGYLPGDLAMYENMRAHEFVDFMGRMRGGVPKGRVAALAERLDLDLGRHIRDLSKGNKQKLGVLQAFMHDPKLLVLDEPTSGLDPLVQLVFQEIVRETTGRGASVFLSSHILAEVEQLADRVGIVVDGHLVVVERIDALKERAVRRLDLDLGRPAEASVFAAIPGVTEATARGNVVTCAVTGHVTQLLAEAVAQGVVNVVSHEPDLEEIFLGYVGGGGGAAAGVDRQDVA